MLRAPVRVLKFRRQPPAPEVTAQCATPERGAIETPKAPAQALVAPVVPLLSGDPSLARRVRFAAVNLCTLTSIGLGLTAILLATQGEIQLGAVLLLGCVFFDGLDGALARKWGVSTPFGAQMDSMADMCSFGIATPVVAYAWLQDSTSVYLAGSACALMASCAAIRLARFNITPYSGVCFAGVPTTIAAGIVVLAILFMPEPVQLVGVAGVAVLALLMVSTFPYVKLQRMLRIPVWLWTIPIIAGYFFSPLLAFGLLVAAYLASGPVMWARNRPARVAPEAAPIVTAS